VQRSLDTGRPAGPFPAYAHRAGLAPDFLAHHALELQHRYPRAAAEQFVQIFQTAIHAHLGLLTGATLLVLLQVALDFACIEARGSSLTSSGVRHPWAEMSSGVTARAAWARRASETRSDDACTATIPRCGVPAGRAKRRSAPRTISWRTAVAPKALA
jgi:hypothetical protein